MIWGPLSPVFQEWHKTVKKQSSTEIVELGWPALTTSLLWSHTVCDWINCIWANKNIIKNLIHQIYSFFCKTALIIAKSGNIFVLEVAETVNAYMPILMPSINYTSNTKHNALLSTC